MSLAEIAEDAEKSGNIEPIGLPLGKILNHEELEGCRVVMRFGLCLGRRPALLRRLLRSSPALVSA